MFVDVLSQILITLGNVTCQILLQILFVVEDVFDQLFRVQRLGRRRE